MPEMNIESSDSASSVSPGERDVPQRHDEYISDDDSIPSLETRSYYGLSNDLEPSFSWQSEDTSLVSDDESQDNHTLGLSMAPHDWLGPSTAHYFVDDILTDALGRTRFQST